MSKAAIATTSRVTGKCPKCGDRGLKELVGAGMSRKLLVHCAACGYTYKPGSTGCVKIMGVVLLSFLGIGLISSFFNHNSTETAAPTRAPRPKSSATPISSPATPLPSPQTASPSPTTGGSAAAVQQATPISGDKLAAAQRSALDQFPELAVAGFALNTKPGRV